MARAAPSGTRGVGCGNEPRTRGASAPAECQHPPTARTAGDLSHHVCASSPPGRRPGQQARHGTAASPERSRIALSLAYAIAVSLLHRSAPSGSRGLNDASNGTCGHPRLRHDRDREGNPWVPPPSRRTSHPHSRASRDPVASGRLWMVGTARRDESRG